ncbi:hypothetical protein JB92DRAFT_3051431 [Gautieria morchelliformis]|nr:hypothetical protein JB92DRAFT_3051431 [Gautieria morchelliformis]
MAGEHIFRAEEERQIKFFIQKDLGAETIETLHRQIIANGGRIETKVPIQGFVLIDPRSTEGTRLRECWATFERPLRNFVPYTFVAACLEAHKLIPQVLRKNGVALKFHIHPCITNESEIETLRNCIGHSGGDPLATEPEADVIIADDESPWFRTLIDRYDHYHNKFVESVAWIKHCVESGVYENTPVIKKNLGGRIPGNKRTEFTPADDNLLAGYIACRLPDPTMRGRTGNKLYQDLCSRLDEYPWAERHPWQSWRERYKNHSLRFNKLIATFLEHYQVSEDGKGQQGYVRVSAPSKSQSRLRGAVPPKSLPPKPEPSADNPEDGWGSQWSVKVGRKSPPAWGNRKRKTDGDDTEEPNKRKKHREEDRQSGQSTCNPHPEEQQDSQDRTLHAKESNPGSTRLAEVAEARSAVPPGDDAPRARSISSAGDELIGTLDSHSQDANSEDDVGPETQALLDASRAILTTSNHCSRLASSPSGKERENTNMPPKPHSAVANAIEADAKVALIRIACEYRFILDEVMEEYEELGRDLDATSSYFKEIRAFIKQKKNMRLNPVQSL